MALRTVRLSDVETPVAGQREHELPMASELLRSQCASVNQVYGDCVHLISMAAANWADRLRMKDIFSLALKYVRRGPSLETGRSI